jgi:hypothetical protein
MTYTIPPHRRGDTWNGINSITITVNNVPVNFTGASIKMEFRQSIDSPVVLTLSTQASSIIITNPAAGVIQIPARMIEIPYSKYLYDLQVTFPSGVVKTYMSGTWTIAPDITE